MAETVKATRDLDAVETVIVIDDGSEDGTTQRASAAGAKVVRLEKNVGKGAALDVGLEHAGEFDVLLLLDADLGHSAVQAERLLTPIVEGRADMTIATFPPPERPGGFGLVKALARNGIRRLGGGFEADAPLSGQRALTRETAEAVTPFAFGFGVEVAMTVRALRKGLRIEEVATEMSHAETGRDIHGFLHRGRQFIHVAVALTRLMFERG